MAKTKQRKQFAALPYRKRGGRTEVLLITSRETRRWVIPKGWAEKGLSGAELAAKEAFEEAGVLGEVWSEPIGSYRYDKRMPNGTCLKCNVSVFPLAVARELEDWPERKQRDLEWVNTGQAAMRVNEGGLVHLLLSFGASEDL